VGSATVRTLAAQARAAKRWYVYRFGRFDVDDQLELRWSQDWQIGGLRAAEDLAGVDAGLAIGFSYAGSIT